MSIQFCKPMLGNEETKAIQEVMDSGWIVNGKKAIEFENEFAKSKGRSDLDTGSSES